MLIDDIVALGEQIQKEWKKEPGNGEVEIVLVPGEAHDSFIVDRLFGADNIRMKVEVRRWMMKVLE